MKTGIKNLQDFKEFSHIFKVFESFPFFEKWTEEEVLKEFDLNSDNGHIFGYYQDGKCVGFISMRNHYPNEHPVHYGHESRVVYISDLAVLPKYRRCGIATQLLEYAVKVVTSEGYEYAYLRINENNPMAFNIAKKQGFRKEYDSCEVVSRAHTHHSCRPTEEFRIFMSKKL